MTPSTKQRSHIVNAMRPALMHTLNAAVLSGDAPAAKALFQQLHGRTGRQSTDASLAHIGAWLSRQGETASTALEI